MQSWGNSSRFNHRSTTNAPTKSGILGLVAAAQGRRRTDPVEDLVQLRFGVRIDQPGSVLQDFQTTHDSKGKSKPLSYRSYLTDAVFVAGLEGEDDFLKRLDWAIQHPKFPLFLGRRSCPPEVPVSMGIFEGELVSVIEHVPWQASDWFKKQQSRIGGYHAAILCDAVEPTVPSRAMVVRDIPISWDPTHREFAWRTVTESSIQLLQPEQTVNHAPFELGEDL